LGQTYIRTSKGRCSDDRRWCGRNVADTVRMMACMRVAVRTKLYGAVGGWRRGVEWVTIQLKGGEDRPGEGRERPFPVDKTDYNS
jgi:hypothetical protein